MRRYTPSEDRALMQDMCRTLAQMQSADRLGGFIVSLCSEKELRQFIQRWRIATLLHMGFSYRVIQAKTGAGTATVARIARQLEMPSSVLGGICMDHFQRLSDEYSTVRPHPLIQAITPSRRSRLLF